MPMQNLKDGNGSLLEKKSTVIFVLGGPGSGKGTQCANIVQHFGYTHLSAGDLLRAEVKSSSENSTMIQNMIKEGKIVPSEVTIKLLQRAMQENGDDKFLIDGFPRNEENRAAFENVTGIEPAFVLYFDCPEKEMERQLLNRNQGREDDNIETIRKRFKVFLQSSLPVINYYDAKQKVRKIDVARPIEEVFESVKAIFGPKNGKVNHYVCFMSKLYMYKFHFVSKRKFGNQCHRKNAKKIHAQGRTSLLKGFKRRDFRVQLLDLRTVVKLFVVLAISFVKNKLNSDEDDRLIEHVHP
ncbi:UMP-CMP kinase 3-like [Gastrolobium bilobum]|uniref:UMP-CMP kinase 3-like n=1 Tax=Gastrolobium bilobum TaxID=150636 RepID=UPI002AB05A16|nr:UMP-CMP kinase 3-like [Gastrolobium bilobum]